MFKHVRLGVIVLWGAIVFPFFYTLYWLGTMRPTVSAVSVCTSWDLSDFGQSVCRPCIGDATCVWDFVAWLFIDPIVVGASCRLVGTRLLCVIDYMPLVARLISPQGSCLVSAGYMGLSWMWGPVLVDGRVLQPGLKDQLLAFEVSSCDFSGPALLDLVRFVFCNKFCAAHTCTLKWTSSSDILCTYVYGGYTLALRMDVDTVLSLDQLDRCLMLARAAGPKKRLEFDVRCRGILVVK